MHVYIDIVFHEMTCNGVHLDIVDVMGASQDPSTYLQKTATYLNRPGHDTCPPCYPNSKKKCCTCDEVRKYMQENKITDSQPDTFLQCRAVGEVEGCRITAYMPVPKIQGNFHVAPGHTVMSHMGHSHQLNPLNFAQEMERMKLSHTILHLKFGHDYPGMKDPLTNYHFNSIGLAKQTYFLRLVPTQYIDGYRVIQTHQYSVTNHTDHIDLHNAATLQLPGVFFKYDFSPMLVKLEVEYKYFTHLITKLCAIIGGTWVVLGMVYSTGRSAVDTLKKKQ